jgi:hypothetical protein
MAVTEQDRIEVLEMAEDGTLPQRLHNPKVHKDNPNTNTDSFETGLDLHRSGLIGGELEQLSAGRQEVSYIDKVHRVKEGREYLAKHKAEQEAERAKLRRQGLKPVSPRKKKDYTIEALRLAASVTEPLRITDSGEYCHLIDTFRELVLSDTKYVEVTFSTPDIEQGEKDVVLVFYITTDGRKHLADLEAQQPLSKLKSKSLDIGISIVVAAVTAVIVTIITNKLTD